MNKIEANSIASNPKTPHNRPMPGRKIVGAETYTTVVLSNDSSVDLIELERRVTSMMEKSQNMCDNGEGGSRKAHICKVCGKEGRGSVIKEHIESNHLDGIAIPCNLCGKTSRSRPALKTHISIIITNNFLNFSTRTALRKHRANHYPNNKISNAIE